MSSFWGHGTPSGDCGTTCGGIDRSFDWGVWLFAGVGKEVADFLDAVDPVFRAAVFDIKTTIFDFQPVFSDSSQIIGLESPLDGIPEVYRGLSVSQTLTQDPVVDIQDVNDLGMNLQILVPSPVMPAVLTSVTAELLVRPSILNLMSTFETSALFPLHHIVRHFTRLLGLIP